jgi:hypothetical protein
MFRNRKLVIATRHHKEKVIAPVFEKEFGVQCFVQEAFDTDTFGTFSGEVEREHDPVTTVRRKCLKAMDASGADLGIASEGSFGPHPVYYFAGADEEFLIFIDRVNQLEIIAREISTETNFNAAVIHNQNELISFAEKAGFPSHGLILRKSKDEFEGMRKGINDKEELLRVADTFFTRYDSLYAETDMRAMFNPTRMKVIEKAAYKLVEKIKSRCPHCDMPGFSITDAIKGLPCSSCGMPTRSVLSYVYTCAHCRYEEHEKYPAQKFVEDPMYCDHCNP